MRASLDVAIAGYAVRYRIEVGVEGIAGIMTIAWHLLSSQFELSGHFSSPSLPAKLGQCDDRTDSFQQYLTAAESAECPVSKLPIPFLAHEPPRDWNEDSADAAAIKESRYGSMNFYLRNYKLSEVRRYIRRIEYQSTVRRDVPASFHQPL